MDSFTPRRKKRAIYKKRVDPPPTTKKFDQFISFRKHQALQEQAIKLEERVQETIQDATRKREWAVRIRPLLVDNSRELKRRSAEKRQEAERARRNHARAYRRQLKEMKKRVDEAPLLLESDRHLQDQKRARRKALLAVRDSLVEAGVQDYLRFFDSDELDALELEL